MAKSEKLVIAGIEGFIGHNFFQALRGLSPTAQVYGIDKSFRGKKDFTAVPCDLTDKKQIKDVLSKIQPNYVFHLAGVPYSESWDSLYEGNVKTTISLLESIKEMKAPRPRVVIVGSAAEYGFVSPNSLPINESTLPNPISLYGASMCCRTIAAITYKNMGLDVVVGRIFNVLGHGLSEQSPIGSFAKQIVKAEKGNKEPVISAGRLDVRRDFLDIADATRALYLLALHGKSGEVYNICSGKSFSIGEALRLLLKNTGLAFKVITVPSKIRKIDVPEVYGSYQKIKEDTGWQPAISMEESLKRTLKYYRETTKLGVTVDGLGQQ